MIRCGSKSLPVRCSERWPRAIARVERGLSLVELLVSIGVIGVLLSLAVPALRNARRAAGEAVSLSNLSQLALTVGSWSESHSDLFPHLRPDTTYHLGYPTGARPAAALTGALVPFAHLLWPAVIRDEFPMEQHAHAWISPGRGLALPQQEEEWETHGALAQFIPSYELTASFNASPRLWTAEGAATSGIDRAALLAVPRTTMVAHPGAKVMFFDSNMFFDRRPVRSWANGLPDRPTPMLFADGHANSLLPSAARQPFLAPLVPDEVAGYPLHNTPRGVLGADY